MNNLHALRFTRPIAGAEREGSTYVWRWQGAAIMGVLNVTPDSFSDGGRYPNVAAAVHEAKSQWSAGAEWIDVGGVSTRPGAAAVPADVEAERVIPVIRALRQAEPHARISVDTSDAHVARDALQAGADMVNDIRGLRNPALRRVCAELGAPAVINHLRGEPASMQSNPQFHDVLAEVIAELKDARTRALDDGVIDTMLDPGIGFGKTDAHNLELLRGIPELVALGSPLLIGASRKRTLGTVTGEADAAQRDPASVMVHHHARLHGAAMVRVHNVNAHVQAWRVWRWLHG